ncbi:MAG TPA: glycosyl transferase family 2 [Lachnospiraceae bacterium]|nr:glycosyl transferase family 2 [Lachnospiraceae bacterium]
MSKANIVFHKVRENACSDKFITIEAIEVDVRTPMECVVVFIDSEKFTHEGVDILVRDDRFIWDKYDVPGHNPVAEVFINIPKMLIDGRGKVSVAICDEEGNVINKCFDISVTKIKNSLSQGMVKVDSVDVSKDSSDVSIRGWGVNTESLEVLIADEAGNRIEAKTEYVVRKDIETQFPELRNIPEDERSKKQGFLSTFSRNSKKVKVHIIRDGKESIEVVDLDKALAFDPTNRWHRAMRYYNNNGLKSFINHGLKKLFEMTMGGNDNRYEKWMELYDVKEDELEFQRNQMFENGVKFSIIVPLYNTPLNFLDQLVKSVEAQTYPNWQLCFADGSSNNKVAEHIKKHIDDGSYQGRITYRHLEENKGISENTNEALKLAVGEYIVLADHDDVLAPNALYELMVQIDKYGAEVIYSDEDKIDINGKDRFEPYFKSGFNIDLLCSNNYVCHLFCVKKEIADKVGGFDSEYDGAQDHDFILKCVSEVDNVYHIPKILYHWRSHKNSTAENPESKLYAFKNGKKAVKKYFDTKGIEVEMEDGIQYGQYHARHIVKGSPLVSIIIPNKDHTRDLDMCLKSIMKNTYDNYEVIVVENNSTEPETEEYYKNITNVCPKAKVLRWPGEFNFSSINNFGVKEAKGEYLLFLNNDIEAINNDWLDRMLGFCQRDDVGIVGAQLLYPDGIIQHAGVVIGFGEIAGHAFVGLHPDECKAFGRAMLTQDYSAVTAACLLTKKEIFDEVGGFDEEFKVAFNDIDYCLRVRQLDKKVVYNSFAALTHYESKSRGAEDTPEKKQRFADEIRMFQERWADILRDGDPYYNVNLALDRADFAIRQS